MATFPVTASDTGLTVTTAAPQRTVARAQPTTTGATITDSIGDIEFRTITLADTGLTVVDSTFGGRNIVDAAFSQFAVGTGILDNFNRANENPLSGGGKWIRKGGFWGALQLASNQCGSPSSNFGMMSFTGAGDLADCEAFVTVTTPPFPGWNGYAGVCLRQNPASAVTGASVYVCAYRPLGTSGSGPAGVSIEYWDASEGSHILAFFSGVVISAGDAIGMRASGSTLTAYYKPAAGQWQTIGSVTDTNLTHGYPGIVLGSLGGSTNVDDFGGGAAAFAESISPKVVFKSVAATGLAVTDLISFTVGPDIGVAFSVVLVSNRRRFLADIGLPRVDDSLGDIHITDPGMTVSDAIARVRVVPRAPTDTGLTVSDASPRKTARHFIADAGVTFTDDLVIQLNGHNASVSITTVGVHVVETIAKSAHLFRPVPGPVAYADRGCTITDGIRRTSTPPQPPPTKPTADFTASPAGLVVTFTDTSTPGSAPIGSWSWHFGDGGTSSATNPTHTYAAGGTYTVTLTVTTIYGHSSVSKPVSVSAVSPTFGYHIDAVIF